jgi:hypothetical protein
MAGKSLSAKDNRNLAGATNLSPADFPLGSPESRAAARAILGSMNRLSRSDMDARILYGGACYINAMTSPSSSDLAVTDVYRRGKEVYLRRHGPPIPIHLDPHHLRQTNASLRFESVFKREPKAGDVLSFDQLQEWQVAHPRGHHIGIICFIEAWKRQLPEMPCPLKSQDGRLFHRLNTTYSNGVEWEEKLHRPAAEEWQYFEKEALNKSYGEMGGEPWPPANTMPTIPAVTFMGVVDGKHRCRPATEIEIQAGQ